MVALDTWALQRVSDGLRNALFRSTSATQDSTDLAAIYHRLFVMRADWQWPRQNRSGVQSISAYFSHIIQSPRVIYVTDLGQDGFFCRYHPIFNFCQCILMIDVHLVYYFLLNSFFHLFFHLCYVHPTGTIITVDDLVLSSLLSM